MGEVDLLDSLIALFQTKIDQRNSIIASYFTSTTSSSCRHGCFTEEIPEELEYLPKRRCRYAYKQQKPEARKQGRTSVDLETKKRKGGALPLPAKAIMMDANNHWPTIYLTIGRYRFPRCKGRSHVICSKCSTSDRKMALCLN